MFSNLLVSCVMFHSAMSEQAPDTQVNISYNIVVLIKCIKDEKHFVLMFTKHVAVKSIKAQSMRPKYNIYSLF